MTGRTSRGREIAPLVAAAVGVRLREHRERRGASQHGLAQRLGTDAAYIKRLESGRRLPSLPTLVLLAEALGCKPADLLPEGTR